MIDFLHNYYRKPTGRGMKLGGKGHDVESFVDQLKSEGENVIAQINSSISQGGTKTPAIKSDINE
jgi:hypothetical protein